MIVFGLSPPSSWLGHACINGEIYASRFGSTLSAGPCDASPAGRDEKVLSARTYLGVGEIKLMGKGKWINWCFLPRIRPCPLGSGQWMSRHSSTLDPNVSGPPFFQRYFHLAADPYSYGRRMTGEIVEFNNIPGNRLTKRTTRNKREKRAYCQVCSQQKDQRMARRGRVERRQMRSF